VSANLPLARPEGMGLTAGGRVRLVRRDGELVRNFKCPGCGQWGDVDDDQWHGRVSIECPDCSFHETRDIFGELDDDGQ